MYVHDREFVIRMLYGDSYSNSYSNIF